MKESGPSILEKLEFLIEHYGSIEKAAREIGCTERSVRRWTKGENILDIFKMQIDRIYQAII